MTKPPSLGCMTILPSFMVISCSSIGDTGDSAPVTVTSAPVPLLSTPKAAVISPAGPALTHGSLTVRAAAGAVADGPGAGALPLAAPEAPPQPARPSVAARPPAAVAAMSSRRYVRVVGVFIMTSIHR